MQPADRSEASKVYLEVGDHERAMQVALEADRLEMVGACMARHRPNRLLRFISVHGFHDASELN